MDDEVTGRDLRTIWRTIAIVFIAGSAVAGAVVAGIVREVRQDQRIEALEKRAAEQDEEARAEKRRERWRQFREQRPLPGIQPQSGITRREISVRIIEIDGERFAVLPERDLLGIVAAADDLAAEVEKRKACGWL